MDFIVLIDFMFPLMQFSLVNPYIVMFAPIKFAFFCFQGTKE